MVEQLTLAGLRIPGGKQPRPEASRRTARRCYAFGAEVERRARDRLQSLGYTVVRSAGSHGPADLVAFGPNGLLLVQVKGGVNPPSPGELAEAFAGLRSVPTPAGAVVRRELWFWSTPERRWHRHAQGATEAVSETREGASDATRGAGAGVDPTSPSEALRDGQIDGGEEAGPWVSAT